MRLTVTLPGHFLPYTGLVSIEAPEHVPLTDAESQTALQPNNTAAYGAQNIETNSSRTPERTTPEELAPHLPDTSSTQQTHVTRSPPQRSSWFSSLSRSRAKSPSAAPPPFNSPQVPAPTQSVTLAAASQASPQSIPQRASPSNTSVAPISLSPESCSPPAASQVSPTRSEKPSAVSSIDEGEVPVLKAFAPPRDAPSQISEDAPKVVTRRASTSALNPSSSRFMLRIPLLGRPKTPLEEAKSHVGIGNDSVHAAPDGQFSSCLAPWTMLMWRNSTRGGSTNTECHYFRPFIRVDSR